MSIPSRITLSHVLNVIRTSGQISKVPTGRWAIRSKEQTALVIDYSNQDHCGTCNDYINTKLIKKQEVNNNNIFDIEYTYMVSNTPN
jgi:hypothetical protein|tara:strand:+ start:309 stop:569 length:261 start_codon:yes stop_codon:yes gene_type:complete